MKINNIKETQMSPFFASQMTKYDQGKYWIITHFRPDIVYDCSVNSPSVGESFWASKGIIYSKGQLEKCGVTGRLHWQFLVCYERKRRLAGVKTTLGNDIHAELTRSPAVNEYVWKDETSQGRRWEWGRLPMRRNNATDWGLVKEKAKAGRLDSPSIPANIFVCNYSSLKKIKMDFMKGAAQERECNVFWGETGTGKSRLAWEQAGLDAYPKAPTTKFWDGYQGEGNVVMDEFTGQVEITHLLRWLDRYPVLVEQKGSGCVLRATKFWITSNVCPEDWYPNCPMEQKDALMRRLTTFRFPMQLEEAKLIRDSNLEVPGSPHQETSDDDSII